MQIPRAVRSVPEAQVRPPEVDGRVEDEEVPAQLGLLRSQASSNEIGGEYFNAKGGLSLNPRNPLVEGTSLAKDSPTLRR